MLKTTLKKTEIAQYVVLLLEEKKDDITYYFAGLYDTKVGDCYSFRSLFKYKAEDSYNRLVDMVS